MHRHDDRGEVAVELSAHGALGDLKREPRLEPGLEVGAQRVAHEGGVGERGAAVAGHVAEDEGGAATGQGERVVEVAAGAGAVGWAVRDRRAHGADLLGHRRQQRGLEQADLLHQLTALAGEAPSTERREEVATAEEDGQRGQQSERGLEGLGHDLDDLAHRAGHAGVVVPGVGSGRAPVVALGTVVAGVGRGRGRIGRRQHGCRDGGGSRVDGRPGAGACTGLPDRARPAGTSTGLLDCGLSVAVSSAGWPGSVAGAGVAAGGVVAGGAVGGVAGFTG